MQLIRIILATYLSHKEPAREINTNRVNVQSIRQADVQGVSYSKFRLKNDDISLEAVNDLPECAGACSLHI